MSDLRKPYVASTFANLDWSELVEKAIDRVAAAGLVSPLGVLIWRTKYGLESVAYRQLGAELMKIYMARYSDPRELATSVVEQALREFVAGQCTTCRGGEEVLHSERLVVCPECHGSGIRCFSDAERCDSMKLSYAITRRMAHKIGWIVGFLTAEDRSVNAQMNRQLERETT